MLNTKKDRVLPRKLRNCVVKAWDSERFNLIYSGELLRKKGSKHVPFPKNGSKTDTIKIFLFLYKNPKLQGTCRQLLCAHEADSISHQKPGYPFTVTLRGFGSLSVGEERLSTYFYTRWSSVSALQVEAVISHFEAVWVGQFFHGYP